VRTELAGKGSALNDKRKLFYTEKGLFEVLSQRAKHSICPEIRPGWCQNNVVKKDFFGEKSHNHKKDHSSQTPDNMPPQGLQVV
jgi:hypothetical protein